MRLKAKSDRRAEDKYVYNQGHKAGREEGIEIGKSQSLTIFINYMRKNGLSDVQIVEELMTEYGLSYEEALEAIH